MSVGNWDRVLDADEKILWTGRPEGAPGRTAIDWFTTLMGAGFIIVATLFIIVAPLFGKLFVLLHLGAGLYFVFGKSALQARRWDRARYALTDRRMLIADRGMTRSIPVGPSMELELTEGDPGSLIPIRAPQGLNNLEVMLPRGPKGFERIPDARAVYRMIRDLQTPKRETAP